MLFRTIECYNFYQFLASLFAFCVSQNMLFSSLKLVPNSQRNHTVQQFQSVVLNCGNVTGAQMPVTVSWLKDLQIINQSYSTIHSLYQNLNFVIKSAKRTDQGEYRCRINGNFGALLSTAHFLNIVRFEKLTMGSSRFRIALNGYLIIPPLSISAEPKFLVDWRWIFNGMELKPDAKHYIALDGTLVVTNLETENFGRYYVEAYNKVSKELLQVQPFEVQISDTDLSDFEQFSTPNIIFAPKNVEWSKNATQFEPLFDDRLILECVAHYSFPQKLHLKWYLNETLITNDDHRFSITHFGRRLQVKNIDFQENLSGFYACAATIIDNSYLSDRKQARVDVLEVPSIRIVPSEKIAAKIDQRFEISCNVVKPIIPSTEISWYFNGEKLANSTSIGLSNSLIFNTLKRENMGNYQCEARNTAGYSDILSVYLDAVFENDEEFDIFHGPSNQSVIIGSNLILPCEISPKIDAVFRRWFFKNQSLDSRNSRNLEILSDGSLLIKQVGPDNIGSYSCVVISIKDSERRREMTGFLNIIEKPGMPLHLSAKLINESDAIKIALAWTAGFDGNSPVLKYTVEQRFFLEQAGWSAWEPYQEDIHPNLRKVVIFEHLKPATRYEFRILAFNRLGEGQASLPSNSVVLPQQPPTAAPQNVTSIGQSSTSIMVQWQPPPSELWNGPIEGYSIRYRLANYDQYGVPWLFVNVTDNKIRNHLLINLITWREYEVRVAAFNDQGTGIYSKPVYISTLEGVPIDHPSSLNVDVINSTAANLSFIPPTPQTIPGVNKGYKVEFWIKGHSVMKDPDKLILVEPLNSNLISIVVGNLTKFTKYFCTVLCFTSQGDGPRSPVVEFITGQDVPDAIRNLRIIDVSFDSANVTWLPPENSNGILTSFTLKFWPIQNVNVSKAFSVYPNRTYGMLENLEASTEYCVEVLANTIQGPGTNKREHFLTEFPPEIPMPPSNLSISNITSRSLNISFSSINVNRKSAISDIIVEVYIENQTNSVELKRFKAFRSGSLLIEDLRPYSWYKFRLFTENVRGRSEASRWTKWFQTLEDKPGRVQRLNFRNITLDSANFTWMPPLETNGQLLSYFVQYKACQKLSNFEQKVIQNKTKNCYAHITGLLENCTVEFFVQAETSAGLGPKEGASVIIGPQPDSPSSPSMLTMHATEYTVTLTWLKSRYADSVEILSYLIQSRFFPTNLISNKTLTAKSSVTPNIKRSSDFGLLESKWITIAVVADPEPWNQGSMVFTLSYNQFPTVNLNLDKSRDSFFYQFRVIAQNSHGVSYPSNLSPPIITPALWPHAPFSHDYDNVPFFLERWFLLLITAVCLIILTALIICLQRCGKEQNQKVDPAYVDHLESTDISSILQSTDPSQVTYELTNRSGYDYVSSNRRQINGALRDSQTSSCYGAFEDNLDTDLLGNVHILTSSHTNPVSSIVGHYETSQDSARYVKTWRQIPKSHQSTDDQDSYCRRTVSGNNDGVVQQSPSMTFRGSHGISMQTRTNGQRTSSKKNDHTSSFV